MREVAAHAAGWEWEAARRLRLIAATPDLPDAAEQWGGPLPGEGDWPAIRVVAARITACS